MGSPDAVALSLVPITVCTDLLKPGGYGRQQAYLRQLLARMDDVGATTVPDFVRLAHGAGDSDPLLHNTERYVDALDRERQSFRQTLWSWLGGVTLLLMVVLLVLIRWGLQPLHRMSEAVQRLEQGEETRITGPVARELQGLTDNLNALIRLGHIYEDQYDDQPVKHRERASRMPSQPFGSILKLGILGDHLS